MLSSFMSAKLDESAMLKEMPFSQKKDTIVVSLCWKLTLLLILVQNSQVDDITDYLVGDLRSLSINYCFHFFSSSVFCQLYFLCIFEHTLPVIRCIPALCWPKTGSPMTCVIILEVLHAITKNTHSILSCTFLSISMVGNSKIFQT